MRQLGSTLNKSTGNRMVEPYFGQKFDAEGLSKVSISKEQGTKTENTKIVNYKNLEKITNHVLLERKYSANHLIKLRINGVGSFLKMSLHI